MRTAILDVLKRKVTWIMAKGLAEPDDIYLHGRSSRRDRFDQIPPGSRDGAGRSRTRAITAHNRVHLRMD